MIELLLILLLLLANGLFAMTEIAIVSSRRGRLKTLADEGRPGARAALRLAEEPNRFLSTVQIGITLVGIIAGAFGGAALAGPVAEWLKPIPLLGAYADKLAMGVVVVLLTYFSLVIGELVPKRLAMLRPEETSIRMARFMTTLSLLANPAVRFLSWSTDRLLALFGARVATEEGVSKEELTVLVREGLTTGTFHRVESDMVERVFDLAQLDVAGIMTPRLQMVWLQEDEVHADIWHKIVTSNHPFFPVYREDRDAIVGYVSVKSLYCQLAADIPVRLGDIMRPPLIVPKHQSAINLLETFKQTRVHVAFVVDEFGGVVGMVTLTDLLEAIVGDMPSREERNAPVITRREDGSFLIDAMIEIEKVSEGLEGFTEPEGAGEAFQTLAGFLIDRLQRVPREGDIVEHAGWKLEVVDMDGHRVDKVAALRVPPAQPVSPASPPARADGNNGKDE
ncbi:MAG TPA: hemolysin family protein [Chthoniobacteraceae bacterium]|nr:hemolysin family protein [Chthoniobacteraceae bacterium]